MNADKMRGTLFILLFLQFMTGFCSESEVTPSEAADDTTDHGEDHIWEQVSQFQDTNLDESTLLFSHPDKHDNNPLDNLSDLREIHQFNIDLSNYSDHQAIESNHDAQILHEFVDHFDILPDADTRDFNDTEIYPTEVETSNELQNLSPDLYEVVTSTPEENKSKTYDENNLSNDHFDDGDQDGMDGKYFTLLENIHKKFHKNHTLEEKEDEEEIHQEENDVMHPLISLTALKPNSMRLTITPKRFSKDSTVCINS